MKMMQCAIDNFVAGAACMQRRMMEMAMRGLECGERTTGSCDQQSSWTNVSCCQPETKGNATTDIVEVSSTDPRFSTLVKAIGAAGLAETLKQEGPFTVFAPTNDAFAKLPAGTLEELLKPENKNNLVAILTYHVASTRLEAKDIESCIIDTVNGAQVEVKVTAAGTTIGSATVVETNITTRNGVIHVIDEVLLPPLSS